MAKKGSGVAGTAGTRKGPWTMEEDMRLLSSIGLHGEGRWDFLSKAAGTEFQRLTKFVIYKDFVCDVMCMEQGCGEEAGAAG